MGFGVTETDPEWREGDWSKFGVGVLRSMEEVIGQYGRDVVKLETFSTTQLAEVWNRAAHFNNKLVISLCKSRSGDVQPYLDIGHYAFQMAKASSQIKPQRFTWPEGRLELLLPEEGFFQATGRFFVWGIEAVADAVCLVARHLKPKERWALGEGQYLSLSLLRTKERVDRGINLEDYPASPETAQFLDYRVADRIAERISWQKEKNKTTYLDPLNGKSASWF